MDNLIKIIKLVNGDDIVTVLPKEQLGEKSPLIRLDKPLLIKYIPQVTEEGLKDYIALIRWANYTHDQIITIPKDKIMTIVSATEEMSKSYKQISTSYNKVTPPKNKNNTYTSERLDDESNERLNEIFDTFKDTKETIH